MDLVGAMDAAVDARLHSAIHFFLVAAAAVAWLVLLGFLGRMVAFPPDPQRVWPLCIAVALLVLMATAGYVLGYHLAYLFVVGGLLATLAGVEVP